MTNIIVNNKTLIVEQVMSWADGRKIAKEDYPGCLIIYDETDKLLSAGVTYIYNKETKTFKELPQTEIQNLEPTPSEDLIDLWGTIEKLGEQVSQLEDTLAKVNKQ